MSNCNYSSETEKPWQKLRLKDFPDRNAYMREYQYLKNADKVLYRRKRYKKDSNSDNVVI
jgi:hypothetical protein